MEKHKNNEKNSSISYEWEKKKAALDTLSQLDILFPANKYALYHGRARNKNDNEPWRVDPGVSNGGNDTGNQNVNECPTLYTGTQEVATQFALARSRWNDDLVDEVHKIKYEIDDAVMIDSQFAIDKLKDDDYAKLVEACEDLTMPVSAGSPVNFEHRWAINSFREEYQSGGYDVLGRDDIQKISDKSGIPLDTSTKLGAARNVQLKLINDFPLMAKYVLKSDNDIIDIDTDGSDGETINIPINIEYIRNLFKSLNIVGAYQTTRSATVNDTIASFVFFDLDKVDTEKNIKEKRARISRNIGNIALNIENSESVELIERLNNSKSTPRELISSVMSMDYYKDLLAADAGNWEGYTLAEHTETVLRNFEENFSHEFPARLRAPIKLALIAHDLGKPIAVRHNEKDKQNEYNMHIASGFYKKLNIPEKTATFLLSFIYNEKFMLNAFKHNNEASINHLRRNAEMSLSLLFDDDKSPAESDIDGYLSICRALFVCDSGAYTNKAVTRSNKYGYYKNATSFNDSFRNYSGFNWNKLELK